MNVLKVMVNPKGFFRSISPERIGKVPLFIGWVVGMRLLYSYEGFIQLSKDNQDLYFFIFAALLSIPAGWVYIKANSFALYKTGKFLNGQASYRKVVSAVSYCYVPIVLVFLAKVLAVIFMMGVAVFVANTDGNQEMITTTITSIVGFFAFFELAMSIWALAILCYLLGEANQFSAWRGLGNLIYACIAIVVVTIVVYTLYWLVFHLSTSNTMNFHGFFNDMKGFFLN